MPASVWTAGTLRFSKSIENAPFSSTKLLPLFFDCFRRRLEQPESFALRIGVEASYGATQR